jgi:hypothetical protein
MVHNCTDVLSFLQAAVLDGGRGDDAREMKSDAPTTEASPSSPGDKADQVDNSRHTFLDKRFKFAVKCVLSCPIALSKWKDLIGKLHLENGLASAALASDVKGWPHEVLQGILQSWYEQTDKLQALDKLKTALNQVGASNAVGKLFSSSKNLNFSLNASLTVTTCVRKCSLQYFYIFRTLGEHPGEH